MLTRLYIDNYRCLSNFTLPLTQSTLLVGRNGAGKSTVLDVLLQLREFTAGVTEASDAFVSDSLNWWHKSSEQRFELEVDLPTGHYKYSLVVSHQRDRRTSEVAAESLRLDDAALLDFSDGHLVLTNDRLSGNAEFQFRPSRSALGFVDPRHDNTKLIAFREWLTSLLVLRLNPFDMDIYSQGEDPQLAINGSNFGSWLRALLLEDPMSAAPLVQLLLPVLPGLQVFRFEPAGKARVLLLTFAGAQGESRNCSIDDLSEGQRALTVLYAIYQAYQSKPAGLVCFDEPDNFIALPEIEPWLNRMRDAADDGRLQFLASSHHPELLNQMAPSEAVVVSRDGLGPSRARPFEYDGDEALTPAELLARGWIGD